MKAWIVRQLNLEYEIFLTKPVKDAYLRFVYDNSHWNLYSLHDRYIIELLLKENNVKVTYENSPVEINVDITV